MSKQKTDPDSIFLLVSFQKEIYLVFFQVFLEMHIQIEYDSTVFSRIVDHQVILQSDGDYRKKRRLIRKERWVYDP